MRTRSVAAALLLALSPMTFAGPGFAQADDPTVKAARARFNEGVEFFDKGQYENARAAFLQAYALRKHPAVLLNLAQSSLRAGHSLEAAKYFQQYLRDSTGLTSAQRSDGEKGLAEARTKLGRLEVSAPSGEEIFVDGEHVGTAPLSSAVDVEPGSHTVKAAGESKSVNVATGQILPVKFAVSAPPAAPVPVPAPVPAPPPPEEPPSPPAEPAEEHPAPPPPKPAEDSGPGIFSPPKTMTPFWLGISVAVVGGASAVVLAIFKGEANSNDQNTQGAILSAYKKQFGGSPPMSYCTNKPNPRFVQACQNLQTDINQVNQDATAANVAVGIGVAGLVFSAVYYFAASKGDAKPSPSSTARSTVSPVIEPHFQGLNYELRF
jgi:hypothetical protein